jgi:hypothetical protein
VNTLLDSGEIWIAHDFLCSPDHLYEVLCSTLPWDDRFRARKAASFGLPYNYSGVVWPETPWPEQLREIRERLSILLGYEPNNCLAHFYPDQESSMGYHFDSIAELEPETGIAVVSLGVQRRITFRHDQDRSRLEQYPLPSGSVLFMSAAIQTIWKHAILPNHDPVAGRISLTYRRLRTGGASVPAPGVSGGTDRV